MNEAFVASHTGTFLTLLSFYLSVDLSECCWSGNHNFSEDYELVPEEQFMGSGSSDRMN